MSVKVLLQQSNLTVNLNIFSQKLVIEWKVRNMLTISLLNKMKSQINSQIYWTKKISAESLTLPVSALIWALCRLHYPDTGHCSYYCLYYNWCGVVHNITQHKRKKQTQTLYTSMSVIGFRFQIVLLYNWIKPRGAAKLSVRTIQYNTIYWIAATNVHAVIDL